MTYNKSSASYFQLNLLANVPALASAVDFPSDDKVIRQISKLDNVEVINIKSRFMSDVFDVRALRGKLVHIKSDKGTGKSTLLKELIPLHNKILVISNRKTLIDAITNDNPGCIHYEDGDVSKLKGARMIATTIHSLVKIANTAPEFFAEMFKGDSLVFIDETLNVMSDVAIGDLQSLTVNRTKILLYLNALLTDSSTVICADADTDVKVVKYTAKIASERVTTVLNNTYKNKRNKITSYKVLGKNARKRILAFVHQQIKNKKTPIIIPTDSLKFGKYLFSYLCDRFPNITIRFFSKDGIHRTLLGTPVPFDSPIKSDGADEIFGTGGTGAFEINKFIENEQPDILIYTPCITTGTSIDIKGYFKVLIGIYVSGVLTAREARQQLGRYRDDLECFVLCAVERYGRQFEDTHIGRIKQEKLIIAETTMEALGFNFSIDRTTGLPKKSNEYLTFLDMCCEFESYTRLSRNNFFKLLCKELPLDFDTVKVQVLEEIDDKELKARTKLKEEDIEAMFTYIDILELAEEEIFTSAPLPSQEEFDELKKKGRLNPSEEASCEKFYTSRFLGDKDSITRSDVSLYERLRSPNKLPLHEAVLYPERAKAKDAKQVEENVFTDWKGLSGKRLVLERAGYVDFFWALLDSLKTGDLVDEEAILTFGEKLLDKNIRRNLTKIGFEFKRDRDRGTISKDPVVQKAKEINRFLANFGFSLKTKAVNKNGVTVTRYLPNESLKEMMEVIEKRANRNNLKIERVETLVEKEPVSEPLTGCFDYSEEFAEQTEVSFIGDIDITSYDYSPNLDECPSDFFEDCPEFDGPPDDFYTEEYIASLQEIHQLD